MNNTSAHCVSSMLFSKQHEAEETWSSPCVRIDFIDPTKGKFSGQGSNRIKCKKKCACKKQDKIKNNNSNKKYTDYLHVYLMIIMIPVHVHPQCVWADFSLLHAITSLIPHLYELNLMFQVQECTMQQ